MNSWYTILFECTKIIGGIPLILYPFILLPNIMSFAAFRTKEKQVRNVKEKLFQFFLYYSTAYPILYLASWWYAGRCVEQQHYLAAIITFGIPPLILAIIFYFSIMRKNKL